ncbi:hypothetical protein J3R03_004165 [Actinoplanes couchii]|nr:hypothetical protein [Actinoplanes couchii]
MSPQRQGGLDGVACTGAPILRSSTHGGELTGAPAGALCGGTQCERLHLVLIVGTAK